MKNTILFAAIATMLASCGASGPLMLSNNTIGSKRGEASYKAKFIMMKPIDIGAITAARKGGIKKIATVDWKVQGRTYSTVVTGE